MVFKEYMATIYGGVLTMNSKKCHLDLMNLDTHTFSNSVRPSRSLEIFPPNLLKLRSLHEKIEDFKIAENITRVRFSRAEEIKEWETREEKITKFSVLALLRCMGG